MISMYAIRNQCPVYVAMMPKICYQGKTGGAETSERQINRVQWVAQKHREKET